LSIFPRTTLDNCEFGLLHYSIMARGRPPIPESERRTKDLRIPVNDGEKGVIERAVEIDGRGIAAWARDILLREAGVVIAAAGKPRKK
jgi:hypothetical protein